MLRFLGNGVTCLHTQFAFRYRKVPELLAVLCLLQQLPACSIKEGHLASSLLHHSLHIPGFDHHRLTFLTHRVAALYRSCLRHNHQRSRFVWQCILRSSTHPDDVVVHHLQTDHFCLTVVRTDSHIVSIGLHICRHQHSCCHQGGHHT